MEIVLCPMSSWAALRSTPAIINQLANVCRRECHVNNNSPAAFTAGSNQRRGLEVLKTRPLRSECLFKTRNAAKAELGYPAANPRVMSCHFGAFCDAVPGILGGAEAEPSAPWTAAALTRCIEHFCFVGCLRGSRRSISIINLSQGRYTVYRLIRECADSSPTGEWQASCFGV